MTAHKVTSGDVRVPGKGNKTISSGIRHWSEDDVLVGPESEEHPVLSIVIPTLNEEVGIATVMDRIKSAVETLDIPTEVIVSDSSTDRTPEIAGEKGAIVVEPDKKGYGYAYKYGFKFARGEYIAIGDADTTYDFLELPKLFERVKDGGADMVLGTRLGGEIKPGAMPPLHKYVGNPLLTKFLNVFYEAGVSDAHSGFRVMSAEALHQLTLESDGMEFASEMVMEASSKGLTIEEVPITYHEREGEATLNSFQDGWRHVKFMLVNAPGYLFSIPALLLGVLGVVFMISSLLRVSVFNVFFGTHTMVGGSLLTILGFQIGTLAVFSSVAANPIREPKDPVTNWVRENFKLGYGTTIGMIAYLAGALILGQAILGRLTPWSFPPLSLTVELVGLTAVVIGTQMIFSAFFLSVLGQERGRE